MEPEDGYRRILHIDVDAFFASVEQRDNPELRGKPIAVGLNTARGVVASASYEARKFGVRSAMPSGQAAKLCPNLIFVKGRMEEYKRTSAEIFSIFSRYTDVFEPVSIDEAFLDVTAYYRKYTYAMEIAKLIRQNVRDEIGLVVSAGVSYNKFLAKIASDWRKPDGLCVIHPDRAVAFIDRLPVKAIWGVGPVTQKKMEALGIKTGRDLRNQSIAFLSQQFGKAGVSFYNYARGIDNRPVETSRIRKQVSAEVTFSRDEGNPEKLEAILYSLTDRLITRLQKNKFRGTSLTLKVRFHDFRTITRTTSVNRILIEREDIYQLADGLLRAVDLDHQTVRLLGISIGSRIEEENPETLLPLDILQEELPL